MIEVYYIHVWIFQRGKKIDIKNYGYMKAGGNVDLDDLEGLLRGNGAWARLRSFG